MAASTVAADTAAPLPPPAAEPAVTAVPDQKLSHPPPPQPDAPAQAPAPAPKKRKLEDAGFHTSDYYKIRAVVADLRVRFVQVYEAPDFRNSDAAREILKEIKVVMELSKKIRLKLGATSVPVKPSKDEPAGPIPSVENNQAPQVGPALPVNIVGDDAPIKHDNSESTTVKTKE
ncbi:uncharacterized protein LOC133919465 [Phragmites australis]|uniref:uncharacterized protein LOC133919465 n=1 Tax=Phragmites australis TaxID=29695 RepID=UPI002D79B77F|nr:uncharacterized protein LOC133919465 [Phragmites australis]